jgi:hypothetical protein
LKNPAGTFRALTIRVKVFDGRNNGYFPAPPAESYALVQKLEASQGPAIWSVGQSQEVPWDFVGFPLRRKGSPLTLQELRNENAAPKLKAMLYSPGGGADYREVGSQEALPSGKAVWLANDKPLNSLKFPAMETDTLGKLSLGITLKQGWNAVSNPRLDTLYWPVSRIPLTTYMQSQVKGLIAYRAEDGAYITAETLLPWRGYWVFYRGNPDTVVNLLSRPLTAAKTAAHIYPVALSLQARRGIPLYLGAGEGFSDAYGWEDEPMIPSPMRGPWAALLRGKQSLMTDQVAFRPGAPLEWRLELSAPEKSSRGAAWLRPDSAEWRVPGGYQIWALSKRRGLRFELKPGMEIRSPEGFSDTLSVFVAPSSWIEANLGGVPTAVDKPGHRLVRRGQNLELQLQWPGEGPLRVEVFNLSGRRLASQNRVLPEGRYRLQLELGAEKGLLLLRLSGRAGTQKIFWTSRAVAP